MFTYAAATIRSNKRTTLFILALQFVSAYCGGVTFSYWGRFWVEGLKFVTCIEQQRDKKYQNKYGGARSKFNTKTNQGFVSDVTCTMW